MKLVITYINLEKSQDGLNYFRTIEVDVKNDNADELEKIVNDNKQQFEEIMGWRIKK